MEFEDNIRRVTVREIREELESMMKLPPTFVVRGDDAARNIGNESLWKKKLGGRWWMMHCHINLTHSFLIYYQGYIIIWIFDMQSKNKDDKHDYRD